MERGIRTALVAAIAAGAAAIGAGGSVAPAAAAVGECPTDHGFPYLHRTWIGKVLRVGLGAGECGAAYTGGPRVRRDSSCQPQGQIRLAVWGSWYPMRGDYITVRAYVEAKHNGSWLGATKTNLKWSWDTRPGKADGQLAVARLTVTRRFPQPPYRPENWYQFYAEHAWSVSGFISGEMVRVHVVIRWKHENLGLDSTLATFDERIGRYCFAQEDDSGRTPPAIGAPNVPGIP